MSRHHDSARSLSSRSLSSLYEGSGHSSLMVLFTSNVPADVFFLCWSHFAMIACIAIIVAWPSGSWEKFSCFLHELFPFCLPFSREWLWGGDRTSHLKC